MPNDWMTALAASGRDLFGSLTLHDALVAFGALAAVLIARHLLGSRADQAVPAFPASQAGEDVAHTAGITRLMLRHAGWVIVLTTAINVTMFAAPLHMLLIYDRVLTSGSVETLVVLTVLCVALLLSMALLTAARQWLLIGKAEELDRELSPALIQREASQAASSNEAAQAELVATRQMLTSPAASSVLDLPFTPLFFIGLFCSIRTSAFWVSRGSVSSSRYPFSAAYFPAASRAGRMPHQVPRGW